MTDSKQRGRCLMCGSFDPAVKLSWVDAVGRARTADEGCPSDFHTPAQPVEQERITLWRCPDHGLIDDRWHAWGEDEENGDLIIKCCGLCPRSRRWREDEIEVVEVVLASSLTAAQQRIEDGP